MIPRKTILLFQQLMVRIAILIAYNKKIEVKILFMPRVKIKDQESVDIAIRRFKRACEKAGIMTKLRQIEYYEKPTTKRKRKRAAAAKRNVKRHRNISYRD